MSTTKKPAHDKHDLDLVIDSCEACCWEQYGTPEEFEQEYAAEMTRLAQKCTASPVYGLAAPTIDVAGEEV